MIGARLEAAGVAIVAQLLGPAGVGATVAIGGAPALADARAAAVLMTLNSVSEALAERFVAAGIRRVEAVASASLEALDQAVDGLPGRPSLLRLADLQQAAARRRGTGMVAVQVVDGAGVPQEGVNVAAVGVRGITSVGGWAAFGALPVGLQRLVISPPGVTAGIGLPVRVVEATLAGPIVVRLPASLGESRRGVERAQADGNAVINRRGVVPRVRTIDLGELSPGVYLIVRPALQNGDVPLVSLSKVRIGPDVVVERVVVSASAVPAGTAEGAMVQYVDGRIVASDSDPVTVTRAWLPAVVRRRTFTL